MGNTRANVNIKKRKMIEALTKTLGIVTQACEIADVARTSHYEWMTHDPDYKKEVDSIEYVQQDFIESALMKKVQEGDAACVIFANKTKNRKRGYAERQEIDHQNVPIIKIEYGSHTEGD